MQYEIITYLGSLLWFSLWWARFVFQRHDVKLKGKFLDKLKAITVIKTFEVISTKKGNTGKKTYDLNIIKKTNNRNSPIEGKYIVEFTPEANKIDLTANLLWSLLYWIILFLFDYFLFYTIAINIIGLIFFHFVMALAFGWFVYKQIFYERPRTKGFWGHFLRRPMIRLIPTATIIIMWLGLDFFRVFSFQNFTFWVRELHPAPSVESSLLKVQVWSFAALASFYVKLRKMYHQHCDTVGIVEDPQIMYLILAVPVVTVWILVIFWAR
jgi:hypothetical protein